jgi:Transglycosylase SLT domain/Domain of unknown function (DUF4124)
MYKIFVSILTVIALFTPSYSWGDIYKYVDKNGTVHFSNRKTGKKKWKRVVRSFSKGSRVGYVQGAGVKKKRKCKKCDLIPSRDNSKERFFRFDHYIKEASRIYQIPTAFIKAVIKVESDFDPRVVSYKQAKGLMQIIPEVQIDMGIKHVFDPRENILGGTRLLRYLANIFKGDMVLTLAGYHAGPNAVKRHKGIPPYKSTRAYVPKVIRYYYYFKAQEKAANRKK